MTPSLILPTLLSIELSGNEETMPRHYNCSHKRCGGEPCRQLTDEELEPGDEDLLFVSNLIFNGWRSTSNKFRTVSNLPDDFPSPAEMVDAKMLGTRHGHDIMRLWGEHMLSALRTNAAINKTLTVKQWKAFKKLGGLSA
jgi:hypothetical protein